MRTWFKISFLALTKLNIYKTNCQISTTAAEVQKREREKKVHET
jgi:hypothetical protein